MPTLSRRTVILSGVGVAAVGAVGVTAGVSLWPSELATPADSAIGLDLVRSRFAPLVGSTFTAVTATGTYPLVLDSVDELLPVQLPEDEDRFNLLFTPSGAEPPAGIYTLRHPQTSDSVLFLSAVGPEGTGRRLQALVDRSV